MEIADLPRVHRSEAGQLTVHSSVTFSIAAGETCAITGPSGCGKTTLLGLCAGLNFRHREARGP